MPTIRVVKRASFAMIDRRTAEDERLSFRARGVLLWLLAKPDDWHTDSILIAEAGQEGRDAVRTALNELQRYGYLVRERRQNEAGQWVTDWLVQEQPTPDIQASGNRPSDIQALKSTKTETNKRASLSERQAQRFPGELDLVERCPKCQWITHDCICEKANA